PPGSRWAVTFEATGRSGAPVAWTAPGATDTVDGFVGVICTPASGSTFTLGTTPVICSATDVRSNTASATFHVSVRDTTAPILSLPAAIMAEATSAAGAPVAWSATAADV